MQNKFGLTALIKKTLAVLGASYTALLNTSQAKEPGNVQPQGNNNKSVEEFKKTGLRSKLVLKLNKTNINQGMVVMHTSHSSHSSHASHASGSTGAGHYSHASHVSHSSHYSSVPSYSPGTLPSTPSKPLPIIEPTYPQQYSRKSNIITLEPPNGSTSAAKTLAYYELGSRILFKGCRGTDVKELQKLLVKIGYEITADGYFGESTKVAVVDFQNNNRLTADGKVGPTTLTTIQIKAL